MTFYNNSSKSISYNSALSRAVFQDGYEIDDNIRDEINTMTSIRPGMSIDVKECYKLRSPIDKGIIEIEVRPFMDGNPDHAYSGILYKVK